MGYKSWLPSEAVGAIAFISKAAWHRRYEMRMLSS
jgi:hypothetical protein